jgi:hypothetical protein
MNLKPSDWIEQGYKRHDQKIGHCDYILQKRFDDETGKKYFITIYVYENYNKSYSHQLPEGCPQYSFTPNTQFEIEGNPTVNLELIMQSTHTIEGVEQQIEDAWNNFGKPYYEEF